MGIDTSAHPEALKFFPGDHLAIYPPNRAEIVEKVLQRVRLDEDVDKVVVVERAVAKKSDSGGNSVTRYFSSFTYASHFR